jgi:hypothetical protein
MTSVFQPEDLDQIRLRKTKLENIDSQLAILRRPPSPIRLLRPCLVGHGIKPMEATVVGAKWAEGARRPVQLVPASGAASRMFSFLPVSRVSGSLTSEELRSQCAAGDANADMVSYLLANLERLPFSHQLEALVRQRTGATMRTLVDRDPGLLLSLIADKPGLGLLHTPKGLLPFHRQGSGARSAFEEHLRAGALYLGDGSTCAGFHFTVSAEHEDSFRSVAEKISPGISKALGIDLEIGFSLQDPATDTIASDLEGNPVRDTDGLLLFRPGGHGSLLVNLSRLSSSGYDLVFLKNIDNIAPESHHGELAKWKRLLAAHLLDLRRKTFDLLDRIEVRPLEPAVLAEATSFLSREFAIEMAVGAPDLPPSELAQKLRTRLDRPLRVCGVVPNTGEPGGGPFWVQRKDGSIDGQIVEGSQIDRYDRHQVDIWSSSTHFNPVDLVCSVHDRSGNPYDLPRFVDSTTSFVAHKQYNGQQIKVLERPGLWNGAMADWNTAFVEVPEHTFCPVKTLLDLLRPAHQG